MFKTVGSLILYIIYMSQYMASIQTNTRWIGRSLAMYVLLLDDHSTTVKDILLRTILHLWNEDIITGSLYEHTIRNHILRVQYKAVYTKNEFQGILSVASLITQ